MLACDPILIENVVDDDVFLEDCLLHVAALSYLLYTWITPYKIFI